MNEKDLMQVKNGNQIIYNDEKFDMTVPMDIRRLCDIFNREICNRNRVAEVELDDMRGDIKAYIFLSEDEEWMIKAKRLDERILNFIYKIKEIKNDYTSLISEWD